jgi:hypothetical protein
MKYIEFFVLFCSKLSCTNGKEFLVGSAAKFLFVKFLLKVPTLQSSYSARFLLCKVPTLQSSYSAKFLLCKVPALDVPQFNSS